MEKIEQVISLPSKKYTSSYWISVVLILAMFFHVIADEIFKKDFYETVESFMAEGGRNTAANGENICRRLNRLEIVAGYAPTDCYGIYK